MDMSDYKDEFIDEADIIIIGGGMAYTFLNAKGKKK